MLIKARAEDFARLREFYIYSIENTPQMKACVRWVYGLHPTDAMIKAYIDAGSMYFKEENGMIAAACALIPRQGEDYRAAFGPSALDDDEIAVVHILCVHPAFQRRGYAKGVMGEVLALSRAQGKKALRLDAIKTNTPAQKLYRSLGFTECGQQEWDTKNAGCAAFMLYELML